MSTNAMEAKVLNGKGKIARLLGHAFLAFAVR